jgi:hypothetical protein
VSERDAFEGEMPFPRRIRDEDAERLLAGLEPQPGRDGDLEELAGFVSAIGAAVPARPDPRLEAPLVRELAETTRSAGAATTVEMPRERAAATAAGARVWRPRLALAGKVAVAVALLPAAMAGLAFAGVRLPDPARSALHSVGVELPNQSKGDTASDDEDAGTHDGQASQSRGSENGAAAAASASGKDERARHGRRGRGDRGDGSASQGGGGSGIGGEGPAGVPPGQGGTPPGQGGTQPGQSSTPPRQGGAIPGPGGGGQSAEPHGGGPPGGVPPGQAKTH